MRFLDDRRLYSDTAFCLEQLRKLATPLPGDDGDIFHLYWSGVVGRKQMVAVRSILATQPDANVWLWLDGHNPITAGEVDRLLAEGLPARVSVRVFDASELMLGTPLEGHGKLNKPSDPVAQSDLFRLLVLYHFGGVYADTDVLFLRDLGALAGLNGYLPEFTYQWCGEPYGNSAVLRLEKGGPAVTALMQRAIDAGSTHPRFVFSFDAQIPDLLMLPCPMFDSAWLPLDGKDKYKLPIKQVLDFFRPFGLLHRRRGDIRSMADWFPGAFAYHWHGCSSATEVENSYFGMFERELLTRS